MSNRWLKSLKIYKCDIVYIKKPIFVNFSQNQTTNKSLQDVVTDRKTTTRIWPKQEYLFIEQAPAHSDHYPLPPQQRSKAKALRFTSSFNPPPNVVPQTVRFMYKQVVPPDQQMHMRWRLGKKRKSQSLFFQNNGKKIKKKPSPLSKRHSIDLSNGIDQIVNKPCQISDVRQNKHAGVLFDSDKNTSYFKDILVKSDFYID